MKAYLIAVETIHDEATFAEYRRQVVATLAPFGGQFIARGGRLTVLEGEWKHPRTVIIEFPTRDDAEGWYKSAEYQKVIDLRLRSTVGSLVILDGL
jgi:uncharacterized protein (DUF1330 family)